MIVVHQKWLERAGIGDIVRHFQLRGYDVSNQVGSRYFTVSEKKPDRGWLDAFAVRRKK